MSTKQSFPTELLQAPIADRISYFDECKIRHPRLDEVSTALEQSLNSHSSPTVQLLPGPTGVGKSTIAMTLFNRLLKAYEKQMAERPDFMPVMMVNAIAPNGACFSWKDCFIRVLEKAREPLIARKTIVPTQLTLFDDDTPNTGRDGKVADALRRSVEKCLRRRGTRILIIDEAHHILMVNNPKRLEFQFEALKSLAIETKCTIVLIGTYNLLKIRDQSGQLVRRSEIIHFPRYDHKNPSDMKGFVQALTTLASRLPLEECPKLQANAMDFYHRTVGCVGILKEWLSRAYARHLETENKNFDWEYIKTFSLSVKALETIAIEAMEGEEKLRDKPIDDLISLLDLGISLKPQSNKDDSSIPKKTRPPVGKRSPTRDPVGGAYAR